MLRNVIGQLQNIIQLETFLLTNLQVPSSHYDKWGYFDFCFFCKYIIKTIEKQNKERDVELKRRQNEQADKKRYR